MRNHEYKEQFAGQPITDWAEEIKIELDMLYRLKILYEEWEKVRWTEKFASLLADPAASSLTGLVVGSWEWYYEEGETTHEVVDALTAAHKQLPALKTLFIGDIIAEECEISWIRQTDYSRLLKAYPNLEHFGVRGGQKLKLGKMRLEHLRSLVIETGGLDGEVVEDIFRSDLPALEHLELWLGTEDYGATTTVKDFEFLFTDQLFPNLKYLGLRDSEIADDLAVELASSPLLKRIRILDLSLGTLSDKGAKALLKRAAVKKLEKLDIHHHYCTDEMVKEIKALGIDVDTSDQQKADDDDGEGGWRYVAVSE